MISSKVKIAVALQLGALAMLVPPSDLSAEFGSCGESNVGEIWCSECNEWGPDVYEWGKWECKDKDEGVYEWVEIDWYSGTDPDCDGNAAECEGGSGGLD